MQGRGPLDGATPGHIRVARRERVEPYRLYLFRGKKKRVVLE